MRITSIRAIVFVLIAYIHSLPCLIFGWFELLKDDLSRFHYWFESILFLTH